MRQKLARSAPRHLGQLPALATVLALSGCMPGTPVSLPADGKLHVATEQTRFTATVPESAREEVRDLGGGFYFLGGKISDKHTIVAFANGRVVDPDMLATKRRDLVGKNDAEVLEDYLSFMEPMERASPGRPGNVLRSYETVGTGRAFMREQGIACSERAYVAEDREVLGEGGKPYLMLGWFYSCVDPTTHLPAELGWSERYPVDGDQSDPQVEGDRNAFFDSFRFVQP